MKKPDLIKYLLIATWGLSGLFMGLMVSILFLVTLSVRGWVFYTTIGLAVISGICAACVRRFAIWYLNRKGDRADASGHSKVPTQDPPKA